MQLYCEKTVPAVLISNNTEAKYHRIICWINDF